MKQEYALALGCFMLGVAVGALWLTPEPCECPTRVTLAEPVTMTQPVAVVCENPAVPTEQVTLLSF